MEDELAELEKCAHDSSSPLALIKSLHDSQAGTGRHRCPVCAYALGQQHSRLKASEQEELKVETCQIGKDAPYEILSSLPGNQGGVGRHKCVICAYQLGLAQGRRLNSAISSYATEQLTHGSEPEKFIPDIEGRKFYRLHAQYERSPKNRAEAIRVHGTTCSVCGFDFNAVYGSELAADYIEIHHLNSLAEQGERPVNPATDLAPLCSNCHSMAHRRTGLIIPLEELRALLRTK